MTNDKPSVIARTLSEVEVDEVIPQKHGDCRPREARGRNDKEKHLTFEL